MVDFAKRGTMTASCPSTFDFLEQRLGKEITLDLLKGGTITLYVVSATVTATALKVECAALPGLKTRAARLAEVGGRVAHEILPDETLDPIATFVKSVPVEAGDAILFRVGLSIGICDDGRPAWLSQSVIPFGLHFLRGVVPAARAVEKVILEEACSWQ